MLASGAGLQRLSARWAAVTRGEGGVGHAEMGKTVALGPSWVLGRGRGWASVLGPCGRRKGPGWVAVGLGLGSCWAEG